MVESLLSPDRNSGSNERRGNMLECSSSLSVYVCVCVCVLVGSVFHLTLCVYGRNVGAPATSAFLLSLSLSLLSVFCRYLVRLVDNFRGFDVAMSKGKRGERKREREILRLSVEFAVHSSKYRNLHISFNIKIYT